MRSPARFKRSRRGGSGLSFRHLRQGHLRVALRLADARLAAEEHQLFLEQQPDHGCDVCSRFRRRAVYDIARNMGANVVALGHTADDFLGYRIWVLGKSVIMIAGEHSY